MCVYVCVCVYMYMYVYVCMYVYMYIYICINTTSSYPFICQKTFRLLPQLGYCK